MSIQAKTKEALEKAYQSQVTKLFNVYIDAIITSENSVEGSETAINRFKSGLQLAQKALSETMEVAGTE